MTNAERDYIIRYRQAGKSCAEIARILGGVRQHSEVLLSEKQHRTDCAEHAGGTFRSFGGSLPVLRRKIEILPHRKPKRFCSDACRLRWWHAHRDMEKNAVDRRCFSCGRMFRSSREQKYCSHACYIKARFGGNTHGRNADARAV